MNTPTNNAWLDEVLDKFQYGYSHQFTDPKGGLSREQSKQAILTHIDTVCREARGCVDCKKLRCENCERLWQS